MSTQHFVFHISWKRLERKIVAPTHYSDLNPIKVILIIKSKAKVASMPHGFTLTTPESGILKLDRET